MFLSLYLRRRNKQRSTQSRKGSEVRAGETVSRTHPAALMITPAEGNGTPRFVHTPGTNMRIANRRADGAWEFSDPRAPFTPSLIEDASTQLDPRDVPPLRAYSPYSHYDTPRSSTSELIPQPTTAPKTPSDSSAAPWRVVSPAPSTARSAFLPVPPGRSSAYSSTDSFLDLDADDSRQTTRSPLSPPPARVRSPARDRIPSPSPALPRWSPSPEHPHSHLRPPRARAVTPESDASMTPAARAKAAESRAARAIRAGYDSVDRYSEYAEQDEGLPAY
ncbi:hypothetical protein FB45DRAFT_861831 [Roridomyces roridus]|uniref:Uncharacterized protein n=1 Tax=Roridomyces roridus TaxID=1738132 RepID=A0AAD7CCA4_9AGAR|nr:hypothetical protein FB45DRAFT_861831 [Roridomyces roridus]